MPQFRCQQPFAEHVQTTPAAEVICLGKICLEPFARHSGHPVLRTLPENTAPTEALTRWQRDYAGPLPRSPALLAGRVAALPWMLGLALLGHLAALWSGPQGSRLAVTLSWLLAIVLPGYKFQRLPWRSLCCALALGLTHGSHAVSQAMAHRFEPLQADVSLQARVVEVQVFNDRYTRLTLDVERFSGLHPAPRRVRLGLYDSLPLQPGELWRLEARLRSPRGFANPGSPDQERALLAQGIDALGYVREPERAQRLSSGRTSVWSNARTRLQKWRGLLAQPLIALGEQWPRGSRFMRALVLGQRDALTAGDWQTLRQTGTTHLMVVSGLHLGLMAAFAIGLLRLLGLWSRRRGLSALIAFGVTLAYGLLTGLQLPAQRALVMVGIALLLGVLQRQTDGLLVLLVAAAVLLAFQPLAPLSAGFWLSFLAVAGLLLVFRGRTPAARARPMRTAVRVQLAATLSLMAPLLLAFGEVPWLAPLVNLVHVPLIGFLLPVGAGGLLLAQLNEGPATLLLKLVSHAMEYLVRGLEAIPDFSLTAVPASLEWGALAVFGGLLMLAPVPLPARGLGLLLLASILMPRNEVLALGHFRVHVFDVGQGLAAMVQTREHLLVVDAGPTFGPQQDAGGRIIVPALRRLGLGRPDRVLISHAHSDHRGGLRGLRQAFADVEVYSATSLVGAHQACHAGQQWTWDGVQFRLLRPVLGQAEAPRHWNRHSCVLQVANQETSILFPGDIDHHVERRLAAQLGPQQLLVAPHHGSRSASAPVFVRRTKPDFVIVAAGWPSSFGHPHPDVVGRWLEVDAQVLITGREGMISWDSRRPERIGRARDGRQRYWHWQP